MAVATDELVDTPAGDDVFAGDVPVETTVFRAFEVEEFRPWPAWHRLMGMLRSNGGSFGLSGARGAGKSWLMLRAIEWVRNEAPGTGPLGGIGHWYPSPSEFDAHAFLASLSDSFGTEIDRWYRRHVAARFFALLGRWGPPIAGLAAGVAVWYFVLPSDAAAATLAVAAAVAFVTAVALSVLLRFASPFRREARLAAEAKLICERARYSITRRESTEASAEGGRGVVGRFRAARERELIERPATLSSLVNDFRALATEAGTVAGRVVIAIDELDKMVDPEQVHNLLRNIKGIFEIPHVHFLVSVSDEAARSLSLGALFVRDVFNSSFYTVLEVAPTSPDALAELLQSRSENRIPHDVALVLGVLSGGNPREAVRLAELSRDTTTGVDAVCGALREEALNLRREVVTAQDKEGLEPLGDDARVQAFSCLPDASFDSGEAVSELGNDALAPVMWEPPWSDPTFRVIFGEPWRRLMVRLSVASKLIASPSLAQDDELVKRLRDVVVAASQSARVARTVLEQELRIETEAPTAGLEEARTLLDSLAAEYETIRKKEPASDGRTRRMDRLAARARSVAREASFGSDELVERLTHGTSGDRVMALAVVQTTGDPATFELVLAAVTKPRTPFEGYRALLAMETLLTGLTDEQRELVRHELSPEFVDKLAKDDPPRARLASRILQSLDGPKAKVAAS
jgi:hypothetical protein